jgi:hypothetical protein
VAESFQVFNPFGDHLAQCAPAQVQQLPAFIEWDVTGSEGPILHPLPAPEEPAAPTPGAHG